VHSLSVSCKWGKSHGPKYLTFFGPGHKFGSLITNHHIICNNRGSVLVLYYVYLNFFDSTQEPFLGDIRFVFLCCTFSCFYSISVWLLLVLPFSIIYFLSWVCFLPFFPFYLFSSCIFLSFISLVSFTSSHIFLMLYVYILAFPLYFLYLPPPPPPSLNPAHIHSKQLLRLNF
jgi:hypothetical protein